MSRVLTNTISLAMAAQSTISALPGSPTWFLLEPNTISKYGPDMKTVARRPISKARQNQKGTPVDLDSAVELEQDLTLDALDRFMEPFSFAEAANSDTFFRGIAAVSGGFTIPAATASQAAKFQWVTSGAKTLVYARGYALSANNGLVPLSADLASTDTTLAVAGNSAETPPTNATVELAGIRAATGDLAITVSGLTGTITSGNNSVTGSDQIDFTTIGALLGQFIHVGGLTSGQQFSAGVGYVRLTAIAAASMSFDKIIGTLATDAGTGDTVDLLFGRFIRNVRVDADATDNRYQEYIEQFEAAFQDLGGVGTDGYEYAIGNFGNELTINLPLTNKATLTVAFVGTDTEVPTTSRKTNASTPIEPLKVTAFNTSSSIISLRTDAQSAADTLFKSASIKLNNNASPEKGLGTLGAVFMNVGIYDVTIEAQLAFASTAIPTAIRDNTTVTFDVILKNDDGGFALDVPALTFGGGNKEYPVDQTVLINVTGQAFEDPTLGTSPSFSTFPVLP